MPTETMIAFWLLVFWPRAGCRLPAGRAGVKLADRIARLVRRQGGELVSTGGGGSRFYAVVGLQPDASPHDLADGIQSATTGWLRAGGLRPDFEWDPDRAVVSLTRKEMEMLGIVNVGPAEDRPKRENAPEPVAPTR